MYNLQMEKEAFMLISLVALQTMKIVITCYYLMFEKFGLEIYSFGTIFNEREISCSWCTSFDCLCSVQYVSIVKCLVCLTWMLSEC